MRLRAIVIVIAAVAVLVADARMVQSENTDPGKVILKGNHPPDSDRLASSGDAPRNQHLSMEIRFAVRNQAKLSQLLADQQNPSSPNFHRWLPSGEYKQRFGPRPTDVNSVTEWLKSQGFSVGPASDGALKFSGTVAQAEHAFSIRIARFGDGNTYANLDDPSIPSRFADVIGAILGLDNMSRAVPAAH